MSHMTVDKHQRVIEARKHHHMPQQRRIEAQQRAEKRAARTPAEQIKLAASRPGASKREINRLAKSREIVRSGVDTGTVSKGGVKTSKQEKGGLVIDKTTV